LGGVIVCDSASGKEVFEKRRDMGGWVAFAPDSSRLAVAGWRAVQVLDAAKGDELLKISFHNRVAKIAFSPDGKMLAAAQPDGVVCLWDATGQSIRVGAPPTGDVDQLQFSPDGKRLVVVGTDATLFDSTTGKEIRRLAAGSSSHRLVVPSADGELLAENDGDSPRAPLSVLEAGTEKKTPVDGKRPNERVHDPGKQTDILAGWPAAGMS
jgi:WD40 repeat protein